MKVKCRKRSYLLLLNNRQQIFYLLLEMQSPECNVSIFDTTENQNPYFEPLSLDHLSDSEIFLNEIDGREYIISVENAHNTVSIYEPETIETGAKALKVVTFGDSPTWRMRNIYYWNHLFVGVGDEGSSLQASLSKFKIYSGNLLKLQNGFETTEGPEPSEQLFSRQKRRDRRDFDEVLYEYSFQNTKVNSGSQSS